MHPILILLGILLIGPFIAYFLGRIVGTLSDEGHGAAVAGTASIAVLMAAFFVLIASWRHLDAGGILTVRPGLGAAASLLRADHWSLLMLAIVFLAGLAALIYSLAYMRHDTGVDKFYPVALFMLGAMSGLTMAGDLFSIFVFFELMSISSFVLVSFRKNTWEPVEAGFKYIILSCVGSFLLLLGIALIFMYTGQLALAGLGSALADLPREPKLLMISLIIVGFGVKAAIVPLHAWLPDAHTAAPSGISALLSGVVIQTGLFAMLRVLLEAFPGNFILLGQALAVLGALTMTVGNLTALKQTDLKRMLAYSSIAQMGYILVGLGLGLRYNVPVGLDGGLFHIMTHAFMKGLAFFCAGAFIDAGGTRVIANLRGIGRRMPATAVFFGFAGLGLAGVPPFSGFMSKLLIYEAGFKSGYAFGYVLACLAILNSVISLGYYLPAMATLFATRAERTEAGIKEAPALMLLPSLALAALTVILGVWPEIGLRFVYPAVRVISSLR